MVTIDRPRVDLAAPDRPDAQAAPTSRPTATPRRRHRWAFPAAAAVTAAVTGVVGYVGLADAPPLFDEFTYVDAGRRYLDPADAAGAMVNQEHPPLAKLLFGLAGKVGADPLTAARFLTVTLVLASAVLLGVWIGRRVDRWAGLLVVPMVVALPTIEFPADTPFARSAMLDPVAGALVVAALAAGWRWFDSRGAAGWWWAVATGMLLGAGTSAKENAFLGLIGPVLLGLCWRRRRGRRVRLPIRLGQLEVAIAACVLTFAVTYLPLGDPLAHIRTLIDFQLQHARTGHAVGFAGQISIDPPWWVHLWFMQRYLGLPLLIGLTVAGAAALWLRRRDPLMWWLAVSVVAPFVFHALLVPVKLRFYWIMWTPALFALSAVGIVELARLGWRLRPDLLRGGRPRPALRPGAGAKAAAVLACLTLAVTLFGVGRQVVKVVSLEPVGAMTIAAERQAAGLTGVVLVTGVPHTEVAPYVDGFKIRNADRIPKLNLRDVDLIAVGAPRCGRRANPEMVELMRLNAGLLQPIHTDRLITLYRVTGKLTYPADLPTGPMPLDDETWATC